MTPPSRATARPTLWLLVAVATLVAAVTLVAAPAQAARPSVPAGSARVGSALVSLEQSASAVPVGGAFGFTASVESERPIEYLQVRMRLFMPSGPLVYQKTFIEHNVKPGVRQFSFQRSIDDIDLQPAAYPVELSVQVASGAENTQTVVPGALLVFDPKAEKMPVALIARVSAQPLADPDGRFVSDPAQFTRARDDVRRLAEYVLLDRNARLTLSLSPVMLEEWRRIAGGYRFAGAEGDVEVAAGDTVPRAYGAVLDVLRRASETGRLEILSAGFSDPSLSELHAARLTDDVEMQYRMGTSAIAASVGVTPTAGVAPPGGVVPPSAVPGLNAVGVRLAVVCGSRTRVGDKAAPPGAYQPKDYKLKVLVCDDAASRSVASSSTPEALRQIFSRRTREKPRPVSVLVNVGPGGAEAGAIVDTARSLASQDWLRLQTASAAAEKSERSSLQLRGRRADDSAPSQYWPNVGTGRSWAEAIAFALPDGGEEVEQARRNSLIAEGSAWAGFSGDWAPSGRGLAHAASAQRAAEGVLGRLTLSASPITLAGASGEVPVTIGNATERIMRVTLVTEPGPAVRMNGQRARTITLRPGENFVEVPVTLKSTVSGSLRFSLRAANVELADTVVSLRASYLDRLAIIGGIVVVLGALLAFIISRVRAAEPSGHDAPGARRR